MISKTARAGNELRVLLAPLFRWWWLLLIVPLISGGIAYLITKNGPTYYQGRMLLNIGPPLNRVENITPSILNIRLGSIYSQIVKENDFKALVSEKLGNEISADQIAQSTVVFFYAYTPLIEIFYVDSDSARVLTVLKTIGELLTGETPQIKNIKQKSYLNFLFSRKAELQTLIQDLNQQINQLGGQKGVRGEVSEQNAVIDTNILGLKGQLAEYQEELQGLDSFNNSDDINQLSLVEDPHLVPIRLGAQPNSAGIAMGAISLAMLVCFCYLFEFLDNKVKTRVQLESLTGLKIINNPPARNRSMEPAEFELVAAELLTAFETAGYVGKYRVLLVYEENTLGVAEASALLAKALAVYGYVVTNMESDLETGVENHAQVIIDTISVEPAQTENSLAIQKVATECELISQSWPINPAKIGTLSFQSQAILILCSLRHSGKKELADLARLYQSTAFNIVGILVL